MIAKDILSFSPASVAATFGVGKTEAEDLDIVAGFKVQLNGVASGGAMLQATGPTSTAAGAFDGAAGVYDLIIEHFDESDGDSSLDVFVNETLIDSFVWDLPGGAPIANNASKAFRLIPDIDLAPGDILKLTGSGDGGEPLRTDFIEVVAAASPPPPAIGTGFTVEAEDLTIISGFKVMSNGAASGGQNLQDNASSGESRASYTMAETGVFDLTIDYFDETDGVSSLRVLVNGIEVDSFDWDSAAGSTIANKSSLTNRKLEGLALAAGDVVELAGFGDGGEPLRIDKLLFEPSMAPPPPPAISFVVEAEDLDIISGFKVESNGAASGGETLKDNASSGESRASYTMTQDGVFELTVGYFDETDGVSNLRVLVNGTEVDSFVWDSLAGSGIANKASAAEHVVPPLLLQAGDVVEVAGFGDGGEPLRVDYLRFDSIVLPPPPVQATEDIWYEDFGDIVVATNDGFGNFSEIITGIDTANGLVKSGDFNGDDIVDFVQVNPVGLPVAGDDPSVAFQKVDITVFTNDGLANFTPQTTQTVFASIPSGSTSVVSFQLQDVGDIDGDGDLDLLAAGFQDDGFIGENFFFVFENNGLGGFTPLSSTQGIVDGRLTDAFFADLNGDTDDDVVLFTFGSTGNLEVYIGDGLGGFSYLDTFFAGIGSFGDEQVVDLDGDFDLDILFSSSEEDRSITGFINDGTGLAEGEGSPGIYGDADGLIGASVAADFDGDGDIEIISAGQVLDDGTEVGFQVFDVVETAGEVDFVFKSDDPSIVGNTVAFGDFDADGDLDVLLTPLSSAFTDPNLSLLVNDGSANFTNVGEVVPSFFTQDFSFAPIVTVEFFDDPLV